MMVDCNGAYLHPAYKTHRKLKCTSPFCGRVDNIATGVTDICSRCSSDMVPIDRILCLSCGREMYNDNCHWCEEPPDEKHKKPHVLDEFAPMVIGKKSPEESKIEYKIKCKYCGDIQILNKKTFEDVLENGCDDECWECMERGYEPVIPDEDPEEKSKCPYCGDEEVHENHECGGPSPPESGDDDYESEKPNIVCWLCEGTGYVMKDRQTGSMHGKHPDIDWSKKDHNEYRCPNCNDVKEGVLCGICDGTGVLGDCIGICEPPNRATHLNQAVVPQCDECDPKWRD